MRWPVTSAGAAAAHATRRPRPTAAAPAPRCRAWACAASACSWPSRSGLVSCPGRRHRSCGLAELTPVLVDLALRVLLVRERPRPPRWLRGTARWPCQRPWRPLAQHVDDAVASLMHLSLIHI
eukprot:5664478-Pyramimonas_sp.AAC.1